MQSRASTVFPCGGSGLVPRAAQCLEGHWVKMRPGASVIAHPRRRMAVGCHREANVFASSYFFHEPPTIGGSGAHPGEFLCLLFLQDHWETESHFTASGMSSQNINSETLWFKREAFYNGLKSKVGLAAAKAAACWVNLNVQGCGK